MRSSIWSKNFVILLVVNSLSSISIQSLIPIMPKYVATMGFSEVLLGLLSSSFALAAMMARPFAGCAGDFLNRRLIITITLAGTTLSLLAYTLTINLNLILLIRFIQGAFYGFYTTITLTAITYVLPEDKMGLGVGLFSITLVGSQAIAPALGMWVVVLYGYNAFFYFNAIITLITTILALLIGKQEINYKAERKILTIKNFIATEAIVYAIVNLLQVYTFASISTFLLLYGDARGIQGSESYFTICAATIIIVRLLGSKIYDIVNIRSVIYICYSLIAASLVLLYFSTNILLLLISACIYGVGYGFASPALQIECIKSVSKNRRGSASATNYIAMDAAHIISPAITGRIIFSYGYNFAFIYMIPILLFGMIIIHKTKDKCKLST